MHLGEAETAMSKIPVQIYLMKLSVEHGAHDSYLFNMGKKSFTIPN